ncbi:hypothetical protein [Thiomicrorhabdus xiamenensis]|uniref:Retention module-containing protein n=1 Tax=Thiomicrorhabdus xiamenensis TaxID=2739063 RepID=A0A7D4NPN1_9GAMM|nr:hypothetical protein [Thiomicrorhabdus xiamenensis]QKI88571.1 hypothetical protein HQN79_02775 [Thiomicrorhabdus xiamenensis]
MEVAKIESAEGVVQIASGSALHTAKTGDSVQFNEFILTGNDAACALRLSDDSLISLSANQKLLLDSDVVNLNVDAQTEAVSSSRSFIQSVVELALANPDDSLNQVLGSLTELLNQSMASENFVDSTLLEDHSLFLNSQDEHILAEDLLAERLSPSKAAELLSLEEALTGDSVPVADNVSNTELPSNTDAVHSDLQYLLDYASLEEGVIGGQIEELVQQLVQAVDLSGYFSADVSSHPSMANLELGAALNEEDDFAPYQSI